MLATGDQDARWHPLRHAPATAVDRAWGMMRPTSNRREPPWPGPRSTRGGVSVRALKILGLAVAVILLLTGGGLLILDRYGHSAAFKAAVLAAAHDTLGSDVQIADLRVSLFSGASLERVTIGNPAGFPGDLLSADALVVRYRLLPLLRRRLEMREVVLERPLLRLARGPTGEWNYERLGSRAAAAPLRPAPSQPGPPTPPHGPVALPLDVILPRLAVTRGDIALADERGRVLARAESLDLATAVSWTASALDGHGTMGIETLHVGDGLAVRRLAGSLRFSSGEVRLAPLAGRLADGDLRGHVTLRLGAAPRYVANLEVKNADVETLLRELHARHRVLRGRLQGRAALEGTGGLSTVVGSGQAEILGGTLIDVPLLNLLAAALRVPGLRELRFDECRVEFALANNVLTTPVIRVLSRDIQLTGAGTVTLATASLDHRLTLAVTRPILDRAPREVRAAFTERADGMYTVDVRVSGPYDAPRTDLSDRVLKGAAEQVLRRELRRLLK